MVVLGEYDFGIRQSAKRSRYEAWLATNLPMTEIGIVEGRLFLIFGAINACPRREPQYAAAQPPGWRNW